MKDLVHDVDLTEQKSGHDCVQSAVTMLVNYYGVNKELNDVSSELSVVVDSKNNPQGSSMGHAALYISNTLGKPVTITTSSIEVFDFSVAKSSSGEIISYLEKRKQFINHQVYDEALVKMLVDGYVSFLKVGVNTIDFKLIDENYIYELLKNGPIIIALNYQALYQVSKYSFSAEDSWKKNIYSGSNHTHAVIIKGYKDGYFIISDPDKSEDETLVSPSVLVAAYYLAELRLDSVIISVNS